jgi:phage-related protein
VPDAKPERPVRLEWAAGTRKQIRDLPEDVQDVFGSALLDVEYGDVPEGARPYGEGLPSEILKIAEDHDGDTYRCAYTVAFAGVAYVLDVFQKKSKRGVATPKADKERVLARYKAAKADYERRFATKYRGAKAHPGGRSSP